MENIEMHTGRIEIQNILTDYFKEVFVSSRHDLINVIYLCTSTINVEYKYQQLNIGHKLIYDVLCECTGRKVSELKTEFSKTGDFGTIAMKCRARQLFISKKTLSVGDVINKLREISSIAGQKSRTLRLRRMLDMVSICSPIETKFIFRVFEENLKTKFGFKTVLVSLGKVFDIDAEIIKEAYHKRPDIEQLLDCIYNNDISELSTRFGICPGIPLKPMLAQAVKNVSSVCKLVENNKFTCENKYDGERIQIHRVNGTVTMYSRNLENSTIKYGEVKINSIQNKNFVLDGEVVAYDCATKTVLPFQVLSTRKRKSVAEDSVQVCVYVFDVLYYDNMSLVDRTLGERRRVLYKEFNEVPDKFYFSEHIDCESIEEVDGFFRKSIDGNYEGIMIKLLNEGSQYLPSQRSNSWIKLKKDYIDTVGDTFDLVVVGAYYGKGKRTGWYGGFLLASYNDVDDVYETVCKIGTGFDDTTLNRLYEELNNFTVDKPANLRYNDQTIPDVWLIPKYVWEVKAAAVSSSPIYSCGLTKVCRGCSLRFPRFIRERDDKKNTDATTTSQIVSAYTENTVEFQNDN